MWARSGTVAVVTVPGGIAPQQVLDDCALLAREGLPTGVVWDLRTSRITDARTLRRIIPQIVDAFAEVPASRRSAFLLGDAVAFEPPTVSFAGINRDPVEMQAFGDVNAAVAWVGAAPRGGRGRG